MTEREEELETNPFPRLGMAWLSIYEQAHTLAAAPGALVTERGDWELHIPAIGTIALRLQA